jgi:hypothetical protein
MWTRPISLESVRVDFEDAAASMRLRHVAVFDWVNNRNSIQHGGAPPPAGPYPPVCAEISIDIRWSGVTNTADVCNATDHYQGRFIEDVSTFRFKVTQPGFSFESDPASTSINEYSEIGRERNGVFFSPCP